MKSTQKYIFPLTPPNFLHYFNAKIAQGESRIIKLAWMLCCAAANLMKKVQPVDAIKSSSAKISKTFENLLLEILLLYMTIQRKINFTQMERYGTHWEQTFRTNFNRSRAKCIDWLEFNLALCRRFLNMDGLLLSSLSVRLWTESKSAGSTLSAASGIQRAYTMYIRDLGPTNRDAPRHLTERSITRNLTSHAWLSCILKDLKAQPTHP